MTISFTILKKVALSSTRSFISAQQTLQHRLSGSCILETGFNSKCIHTTTSDCAGEVWRKKRGMPKNPNAYGPLTDGPDYSFIDGRPTPPGHGAIRRAKEQKEIAEKILQLNAQIDMSIQRHREKGEAQRQMKDAILERKLKKKGSLSPEVRG